MAHHYKWLPFTTLLLIGKLSFSQKADSLLMNRDSVKTYSHFSGNISFTNNGISIVPSFSLEKPAVQFILSLGKGRWSIDPDIRFSWQGKPWTMLWWLRYKAISSRRFKMNTGVHLGLNYRIAMLPVNTDTSATNVVRRYLAGELAPNYFLSKNISVGMYYLYSHGLDAGTIGNTHFVTVNATFSNIKLTKAYYIKVNPQLYYLKLDDRDGVFVTSSLALAKKNFPLSVSCIMNKKIHSNIAGSKDLLWNVSLVYSFDKKYVAL